jgi:MORN repeat
MFFGEQNRTGRGKYNYKRGYIYDGEWENNLKCGIGRLDFNEKGTYFGNHHFGRNKFLKFWGLFVRWQGTSSMAKDTEKGYSLTQTKMCIQECGSTEKNQAKECMSITPQESN